jgi:hypothetical protein
MNDAVNRSLNDKTMRSLLLLLPLFAAAQCAFGQDLSQPEANQDRLFRHSIGLYTTVPATILMGALQYSPRFGLAYRRQGVVNPHRTLRVQAVVDITDIENMAFYDYTDIMQVTSNSVMFRWRDDSESRFTVRTGLEWSDPNERHTPVYGADLIAGVNYRREQRGNVTFPRDTLAAEIVPYHGVAGIYQHTRHITRYQYVVGVALTAGYRFRVYDRWDFLFYLSPEFYYSPYEDVRNHLSSGAPLEEPASSFWMQLRLVEMQVAFRF